MKIEKKIQLVIGTVSTVITASLCWTMFCGYQWSWGPFARLSNLKMRQLPGNQKQYDLDTVKELSGSPLKGKHLCFLGSSVTYGASSMQTAFPEYIAKRNQCTYVKEAVSGTCLVEGSADSYIARLKTIDKNEKFDVFICQLSTNDATQGKPLGSVSESTNSEDFDTKTIAGAIEYIICYVKENWGCSVCFYTNSYYDKPEYQQMVDLLYKVQEKWNITIIDLYTDKEFNAVSKEQRALYMADQIHPTKAGYLEWWIPKFEEKLYEVCGNH